MDRQQIRQLAHRRRHLASVAGRNIERAAERIADLQGIPIAAATVAVFADRELLSRCHQVFQEPVPGPPQSVIEVQNA